MNLIKLSNNVYFTPCNTEEKRPTIGYIRGNKYSIMIDACNSEDYVHAFEDSLKSRHFRNPKLTIITNYYKDNISGVKYLKSKTISSININKKIKERIKNLKEENNNCGCSNICFSGRTTFDLGNLTCEALEVPSPYCNESVSVFIKEDKILFLADALTNNETSYNIDKAEKLYKILYSLDFNKCLLANLDKILSKREIMNILKNEIDCNKKRMA